MLDRAKNTQTIIKTSTKADCPVCRKTFKSQETYNEHLKSKKHLENEKSPKPVPTPADIKSITLENNKVCLFCNLESENFQQLINKEFEPYETQT